METWIINRLHCAVIIEVNGSHPAVEWVLYIRSQVSLRVSNIIWIANTVFYPYNTLLIC